MRTEYREKRFHCGERYMEIDVYPVYRAQRGRGRKAKPTSEAQEKLNQHNAEKKLERLILTNFGTGDYELHLTYSDEFLPKTDEEDASRVRAYLRRVKRWVDKNGNGKLGKDLKYINITEGGIEGKRYHHHMTMSAMLPREIAERLWGMGFANSKCLMFDDNGIEGLVRYITKQSRGEEKVLGKKRWSCSQNLVKPAESQRDGKVSAKKLREEMEKDECKGFFSRLYPGFTVTSVRHIQNEVNGGLYLCVKLCRTGWKDKARK